MRGLATLVGWFLLCARGALADAADDRKPGTQSELRWLATENRSAEGDSCSTRVAHCFVGDVAILLRPRVQNSIGQHMLGPVGFHSCARAFYVLSADPNAGSVQHSRYLLMRGLWRKFPPTGYLLNPPRPRPRQHQSFLHQRCLYTCVPILEKTLQCYDLVTDNEASTQRRFDWVSRTRLDFF